MVFKSFPKRHLGLQAKIKSWRQEPYAYGVQNHRLGRYDIIFPLGRPCIGDLAGTRGEKGGSAAAREGRGKQQ